MATFPVPSRSTGFFVTSATWQSDVVDTQNQLKSWLDGTTDTTTSTGTQNNLSVSSARHLVLRCNNASLLTITGFAPASTAVDGDRIDVISIGAGQVDLSHQNASSTAANRLLNIVTSCVTSLAAGSGVATFIYDGTTQRWRLVHHEQGAWISKTSMTVTANGGGTLSGTSWTLSKYRIVGRTLFWSIDVAFNLSTTPITSVDVTNPAGGTAAAAGINHLLFWSSAGRSARAYGNSGNVRFDTVDWNVGTAQNFQGGANTFQGQAIVELT